MKAQTTTTTQLETSEINQIHALISKIEGTTLYTQQSPIPNTELLPLYILAQKAAEIKKAIDTLIYTRLKQGEQIKGLTLGKPTITRTIEDPCAAYSALSDHLGTQDIMESCTIKVAELEKRFIKKYRTDDGQSITKEEGERLFLEYLNELVIFKTSKEKITYKPTL